MTDQERLGRRLQALGAIGLVAATVLAIAGLSLASTLSTSTGNTIDPLVAVATDIADTIEASSLMVDRTTEAIVSIENTTRSAGRALGDVSQALRDTTDLVTEDIADGLDSAVKTLPGLISTAAVIDTTMRALSLVGVDYDPVVPLDESLSDLENSLRPIPNQMRDQSSALDGIASELDQIKDDSGQLAAVLLGARLDMLDAGEILSSASANANAAVDEIREFASDFNSLGTIVLVISLAAAVSLGAGALAPLMIGRSYLRVETGSDLSGEEDISGGGR